MATLNLDLIDVYGERIGDTVDVRIDQPSLHDVPRMLPNAKASKTIPIKGLPMTQGGAYRLTLFPHKYRAVSRFVMVNSDAPKTLEIPMAVDPARVIKCVCPKYQSLSPSLQNVLQNSSIEGNEETKGQQLYAALDDYRRAGLLNISAKMQVATFKNMKNPLDYISGLYRLRGDRFFAFVAKELRDETINSQNYHLFHEAPEAAHTPPGDFMHAGSYKTYDAYGNLQLTFFSNPSTLEFRLEADIDDAQGIGHVFQVLDHLLTDHETNPYDIHEILLKHQHLDPGYKLVV
jgi:hypothetical protein